MTDEQPKGMTHLANDALEFRNPDGEIFAKIQPQKLRRKTDLLLFALVCQQQGILQNLGLIAVATAATAKMQQDLSEQVKTSQSPEQVFETLMARVEKLTGQKFPLPTPPKG